MTEAAARKSAFFLGKILQEGSTKKSNMKRVIALILTIAMIASMCTGLAISASATETETYVAQIGENKYETLAAAIESATDGQTVTVIKNCNIGVVTIKKAITLEGANLGTDEAPVYPVLTGTGYATGHDGYGRSGLIVNLGTQTEACNVIIKNLNLTEIGNKAAIYLHNKNSKNVNITIEGVSIEKTCRHGITCEGGTFDINNCYIDTQYFKTKTRNGITLDGESTPSYVVTGKIRNTTITNATDEGTMWTSAAVASFANIDVDIDGCNFINCEDGIGTGTYISDPITIDITNTKIKANNTCIKAMDYKEGKVTINLGRGNDFYAKAGALYAEQYEEGSVIEVNVTDGQYVCEENGAAFYGAVLNVKGGTITGKTGIFAKSGTINILGGTINATGDKVAHSHKDDDEVATGDAFVVENCGELQGAPVVSVTGGKFYSKNAQDIASYGYTTTTNTYETVTNFVYGGMFKTAISADYIAEGYKLKELTSTDAEYANGYRYAVVPNYVAQVGDKNYTTLQGAVDAAKNNDTIKVLSDIDYGYITAPIIKNGETQDHNVKNGKKLTLDLNGKTITAKFNAEWPDGNKCVIQNGFDGDLTITGNGKIKIEESNQEGWNKSCSIFKNSGRLTIKNGTFENNGQSDMSYVIDNQACYNNEHAYVVIDDGTFKCPVYTVVRLYPNAPDSQLASTDCAVTINGGTFSGKRCFYIHHHSKDMKDDCKVTINGGSFEATNRIFQFETSGLSKDIVKINISGGEFKTTASEDGAIFHVDSILAESYINGCINVVISEAEGKTTKIDAENNLIFEQQTGKESAMTGEVSGGLFSTKTNVEDCLYDFYTLKEENSMWKVVLKEQVKDINVKDEVAERDNKYIEKSTIPNEITKEKDKILKENNITYDSVTNIISNASEAEVNKDTAKVIVKSYYVVTETATDTDIPESNANVVKLDITPKYDVEVVASSTDNTKIVTIKQIVTDADYKVGEPTEVTVKMPNNFFKTDKDRVKVIHHIGDNETEKLPATVDYKNRTVTFVTNSFSVFEFVAEAPQTLIVYSNQGGTGSTNEITATNGQPMPSVTTPTRVGWEFAGYYDAPVGGKQYYTGECSSACSWDKLDEKTVLYAQWTSNDTKLDNMSIEIDKQYIYVNYIVNIGTDLSKQAIVLSDTNEYVTTSSDINNKFVIKKAFSPEKLHDGYEIILNNGAFRTSTNIENYVSESNLKDNSLLDALYVLERCAYYEVNTSTNNKISSDVIAYLGKTPVLTSIEYKAINVVDDSSTGLKASLLDMRLDVGSFRMYVYLSDKALDINSYTDWKCTRISESDIEFVTTTNNKDEVNGYLLTFPVEYNNLECDYTFISGNESITVSPKSYIYNVLADQQFTSEEFYNNPDNVPIESKLGQRDTTLALWNLYNKLKTMS